MINGALNSDTAPIAVFAYNRPDRLAAMLRSLQACDGFSSSPVTVFVDGPKGDADRASVQAVRDLVTSMNLPNMSLVCHDDNRGLRQSIYSGVSALTEQHGKVIVFEDDLVLSPVALTYFNSALHHYEHASRIWSIAGYVYDAPELRNLKRTLTLPYAHSWGWATWSRSWMNFDLDSQPAPGDLASASFRNAFDMGGLYPFSALMRNSIDGLVNSWFIHWYYTIFKHGGASIFPPRRVLDNYGISGGTHGGYLNPHERLVARPRLLGMLPEFGDWNVIDYPAVDALKHCREARVQRFVSRAGSAKRKIKNFACR